MDLLRIAARVAQTTTAVSEGTMDEKVKAAWQAAAGPLFDMVYKSQGPRKHEIEEMETDREYEARVVECAVQAYEAWAAAQGAPGWDALSEDEKVEVVDAALNAGSFGWYRGDLPATTRDVVRESA